jgi:NAD(P)-dependent dehydrogenase (short-subunit alcohol dehydrogenase family)
MDLFLAGKTTLVTGGTKGIGQAIVNAFVHEGATVAFCARNAEQVAQVETALRDAGARVFGTALDVADPAALRSWVDATARECGGIDMVVANASALAVSDEDASWEAGFQVDLMGTVNLCRAAIPHMENSTVKSLVALSSVSGREASFSSGPYGSFKSAIISYMAGLSLSLADRGIRANTVSPGHTYFAGGTWEHHKAENPELFAHALGLNPTGRMGTPEEVAAGVVFLSSPRASRISGTNLVIDGAMTRGIQF